MILNIILLLIIKLCEIIFNYQKRESIIFFKLFSLLFYFNLLYSEKFNKLYENKKYIIKIHFYEFSVLLLFLIKNNIIENICCFIFEVW